MSVATVPSRTMSLWSGSQQGCGRLSWRHSMATLAPFSELIAAATASAVYLEMRDACTPSGLKFLNWGAGKALSGPAPDVDFRVFSDLIAPRIISHVEYRPTGST